MPHSAVLKVRLTASQLDHLRNQAILSGLDLSKFVRYKLQLPTETNPRPHPATTRPTERPTESLPGSATRVVPTNLNTEIVATNPLCPRCTRIGRPVCLPCRKSAGLA